ncbi:hypothetical protein ACLOJK_019965 [Asimina triloba]
MPCSIGRAWEWKGVTARAAMDLETMLLMGMLGRGAGRRSKMGGWRRLAEIACCRMPWERRWFKSVVAAEEDEAESRHYRPLLDLRLLRSVLDACSTRWVTVKMKRTFRCLAAAMIGDGEDRMEECWTDRGRHADFA